MRAGKMPTLYGGFRIISCPNVPYETIHYADTISVEKRHWFFQIINKILGKPTAYKLIRGKALYKRKYKTVIVGKEVLVHPSEFTDYIHQLDFITDAFCKPQKQVIKDE